MSRKEGGRRLPSYKLASMHQYNDYIKKRKRKMISATSNNTENTIINRIKLNRKVKWEENNCIDILNNKVKYHTRRCVHGKVKETLREKPNLS